LSDEDIPEKSPTFWCTVCGAPHGGSMGDLCPSCHIKS
jgi:rubrerythrin